MSEQIALQELFRCFQGVIPSVIATADAQGIPNVTYVSQVYLVDEGHVALSCQFFNKTRRNLDQNPVASAEIYDPVTFQAYRMRLRFLRSETTGPLFETMAIRIDAIASHNGMAGIFKLIAADVFEVLSVERVEAFLDGSAVPCTTNVSLQGLRTELRGVQYISDRINKARDLESMLACVLEALESYFGFTHSMVLLHEEACGRLVTIASRGYGESGIGAEVPIGEGLIGTVAQKKRTLRMTGLHAGFRYAQAVRRELIADAASPAVTPEIPLPGLCDAQSALVIPLIAGDGLVGVLASESRDPMRFGEWHEAYLEVIGNQIALGIERMSDRLSDQEASDAILRAEGIAERPMIPVEKKRTLVYYRNDDCLFIDGEYLVRNVPGRILWRLMEQHRDTGRREFSNRELRLDESLGLPAVKDNLESRLILLRKRLEEKCPDIAIVPTARGRFALELGAAVEMVEK